jgi:hypothetical protein
MIIRYGITDDREAELMATNVDRRAARTAAGLSAALTLVDLAWVPPMNGPARRLDGPAYRALHRAAVQVGGTAAPILALPALVASIAAIAAIARRRRAGESVLPNLVGIGCLAANAGITFAINVPINNVFTGDAPLPADWALLRRRWLRAHNVRTAVQVAGLAATVLAAVGRGPTHPDS